jgi:hypothetical protein
MTVSILASKPIKLSTLKILDIMQEDCLQLNFETAIKESKLTKKVCRYTWIVIVAPLLFGSCIQKNKQEGFNNIQVNTQSAGQVKSTSIIDSASKAPKHQHSQ